MAAGSGVFQADPAFRIVNRQHCGFYVWRVEVLSLLLFPYFVIVCCAGDLLHGQAWLDAWSVWAASAAT